MEKRLFLAILISIFVLIAYSGAVTHFAPPQSIQVQKNFEDVSQLNSPLATPNLQLSEPLKQEAIQEKLLDNFPIILNNNELQLKINRFGFGIQEAIINKYKMTVPQFKIGGLIGWTGKEFNEKFITYGKIISYDDKEHNLTINENYRFSEDKYILELTVDFINNSDKMSYVDYGLNIASVDESLIKKNQMEQRYMEFSVAFADRVLRKPYASFIPSVLTENVRWIGVRDQYFCSVVLPLQAIDRIEKKNESGVISYVAHSKRLEIGPKNSVSQQFRIYIGPQIPSLIKELGPACESVIHYGFFDTVSQILLSILRFIYKFCHNWGVTLIVFSFLVFAITSPLSIKSFSSMKRMQELQPEIEALKNKFKDNPQKLNREIMVLYKERKVNPFGGCLPMLLQMPIFIALFQLLSRFVELKGANFLWIKDLSEPDRLKVFSKSIPFIGSDLNLLPIFMIIIMLLQQKITGVQQNKGDAAAQQQKMMSLFMAVFFGVIFYKMPSGLVLYWSINSLLMFLFQLRLFLQQKKA